jgi:cytidylate kinase
LRDNKDKKRTQSPLVIPKDAFVIYNDGSFRQTIKQINKLPLNF